MKESVLGKISANNIRYYYEGWRNGKKGAVAQLQRGVYRFIEMTHIEHGIVDDVHECMEDNPVVAVGIVAYWLSFSSRLDPVLKKLTRYTAIPATMRNLFNDYTNERFKEFRELHRDDPYSWNWDWDYEFYVHYIIPNEIRLNKQSEALFDYLPDNDIQNVRSVMSNYIDYLKTIRNEKGYQVNPKLLVLRAIEHMDESMLEDLEDFEISTILDDLENKGYIQVAWIEGHVSEGERILDKGKVYLKQLEAEARAIKPSSNGIPIDNKPKKKTKRKKKAHSTTSATFTYKGYKTDSFKQQRLDLIANHLIGQFILESKTPKSLIEDLFAGREINVSSKITWKGTKAELVYFFRTLNKRKLIEWPKDEKMWVIVASHFIISTELKKGSYKHVDISAVSLQNYTEPPNEEMKRLLNNIIKFFEPDLKKALNLEDIDTEQEAEDASNQELANKDFSYSQKK